MEEMYQNEEKGCNDGKDEGEDMDKCCVHALTRVNKCVLHLMQLCAHLCDYAYVQTNHILEIISPILPDKENWIIVGQ